MTRRGAIYSAFLVEEEGTASTFRALKEVFSEPGLPMSLYTDRGAHSFHTPKAGGEIDRGHPTQVGRARAALHRPLRRERNSQRCEKCCLNPLGGETLWTHGQASGLPTPPTGEQKQKKRTFRVLPKPHNLIRYRQRLPSEPFPFDSINPKAARSKAPYSIKVLSRLSVCDSSESGWRAWIMAGEFWLSEAQWGAIGRLLPKNQPGREGPTTGGSSAASSTF
jgi:hypothetical protein